jgi:hypothetical protein
MTVCAPICFNTLSEHNEWAVFMAERARMHQKMKGHINAINAVLPLTYRRRTDQCYGCANYACPVEGMPDAQCPHIMQEREV